MMAGGTSRPMLIVGKQNVYVVLTCSNYAYNSATSVFSFSTTIQNLVAQPLGTTNGTTPTTGPTGGTSIFFTSLPTPTSGTGTVTILNDSGSAFFTAPNQPFYKYAAIIQPKATSPASTWEFGLPSTAGGFQFTVEVSAAIPAEQSVLRWLVLRQGLTDSTFNGVWQDTPSDIYAVGNGSTIVHYNGSTWSTVTTSLGTGKVFASVYGFGPSDVWLVGHGGVSAHYNGTTWTNVTTPGSNQYLDGVWGSATNDVYAVGAVIFHSTGASSGWTKETDPTTSTLRAIWGSDKQHIWAVGDNGTVLFSTGNGTWTKQTSCTTSHGLYGVWGSSSTNVYAVGGAGTVCHYDGTRWSTATGLPAGLTTFLPSIGGSGANDIWVVSTNGQLLHYTGTWSLVTQPTGTSLSSVSAGTATAAAAVGADGTLLNYNGTSWTLSPQAGLPIYGVWASDTNNIYASSVGTILHYDGNSWTSAYADAPDQFNAISGTSSADVYAVGASGDITHGVNGTWTSNYFGGVFNGVWEISSSLIYADGNAGLIRRGTTPTYFTTVTPASASANLTAIWGDSGTDVFTVASNGSISRYQSGTKFVAMTSGTTKALYAVHGLPNVDVWAAGAGGEVARYAFAGSTWTATGSATTNTLYGVWDAASGDVYAVGAAGTIEHWNGSEWLAMPSGVTTTLRAAHGVPEAGHMIVAGDNGVVLLGTR